MHADGVVYRPRYNLAPGDQHWIVLRQAAARALVPARWGFPAGGMAAPSRLLINARLETAARLATFRDAYRARRCLVPADGFYEWPRKGEGRDPTRHPSWYHHADGSLLLMAGLYGPPPQAGGRPVFTILTMPANEVVAPAHHRMPVVLSPRAARAWLDDPRFDPAAPGMAARGAFTGGLVATAVSTRVNSAAYDGPACLEPPGPPPPPPRERQLRLVD